jgi:hypothetical protein
MTVDEIMRRVSAESISLALDGDEILIDWNGEPPSDVLLAAIRSAKPEVISTLRRREAVRQAYDRQRREAEERRAVVFWVNNNFTPSPPDVCAHCGKGPRTGDPFVRMFVHPDRADVHASCHEAWRAAREQEARKALGFEITAEGSSK